MSKVPANALPWVKLVDLLERGHKVILEGDANGYEVTVYEFCSPDHSHFGGATLTEAINRAWKSTPYEEHSEVSEPVQK